jgi:hypothetical protein
LDGRKAISVREKKVFVPEPMADYERPLGRMIADSTGGPFHPLRSLDEAKAIPEGVVILQGDDGGQIYVVCPATSVVCSPETLERLLQDLDEIAWPDNPPDMRHVFYERLPPGAGVAGGKGGGHVDRVPWIHGDFVRAGLSQKILDVLSPAIK